MTPQQIKDLLKEDIEYKKPFMADRDTFCNIGREPIRQGDTFIFVGDKRKCCVECQGEITQWLEED